MVFAVVVQDDVDFLGTRSADVRAKHKPVRRFSMHVFTVKRAIEYFNVSTAAIDVLFMFDGELDHQVFSFSAERWEFGAQSVEAGVFGGLDTWTRKKIITKSF